MRRTLYMTMSGQDAIAGPVVVTAVYFVRDISSNPYLSACLSAKTRANDIDFLWFDLIADQLIQNGDIIVLSSIINSSRFRTQVPPMKLIRTKVELLTGEFLSLGATDVEINYVGRQVPTNPYFDGIRIANQKHSVETFVTVQLSHSLFRNAIATLPFPEKVNLYGWYKNFGYASDEHLYRIYRYGPSLPIHREEAVYNIGRYWYREYLENKWWAMTTSVPPTWWKEAFPNTELLHFLGEGEREEIKSCFLTNKGLDPKFWRFFKGNLPDLSTPTVSNYQRLKEKREARKLKGKPFLRKKRLRQYLEKKSQNYRRIYDRLSRKLD
mgnify:CR=1 FL=1